MQQENNIIFYDGVCNLCNSSVNFIIKRDKRKLFKYSYLQSEISQRKLKDFTTSPSLKTILYLENGRLYEKSTAALRIIRKLDGIWPIFYIFIIIPEILRDSLYNLITRYRYKWFGKSENCRVPNQDIEDRFLK